MASTVFMKIVRGELPSHKLFEDEHTLAFLDINPLTEGHTLVIPKRPIDHLDECPPELYQAIFQTVHRVSAHLKKALKPQRIALVVHGFDVPHAHVHVVPMYTGTEMKLAKRDAAGSNGQELALLAKKLRLE